MIRTTWLIVLSLVMLFGCSDKQDKDDALPSSEKTPIVSVSNYPLQYFTERLAPWIDVQFPAGAPATLPTGNPAHRMSLECRKPTWLY